MSWSQPEAINTQSLNSSLSQVMLNQNAHFHEEFDCLPSLN